MEERLVLFWMPAAGWFGARWISFVLKDAGTCAVFADADAGTRKLLMEVVSPRGKIVNRATVPTVVAIEGHEVCVPVLRVFVRMIRGVCGKAGRVFKAHLCGQLRQ